MKEPVRWGRVITAGVFALAVIGVSMGIQYFTHKGSAPAVSTPTGAGAGGTLAGTIVPENGITASLSKNLVAQYLNAADQNGNVATGTESAIAAAAVQQYVSAPAVVPEVGIGDLNVSATASLDTYQQLFALIMDQSTRVPEYEVDAFARVVTNGDATSTVELQNDADLYKRIAASLLVMQVPASIAPQHLEVVKSVGALAHAVETMGEWDGDPIQALVDVDTFNKSAAYVQASENDLMTAITSAAKKS